MMMMMIIVVMMMMMNGSSCWYNQVPLLLAFITFSLRLRAPVKGPNARQNFFRMGSRFRFRSEVQNCIQIKSLSNVSTNYVNKLYRQLELKNSKSWQCFNKSCEQSLSSAETHKRYQLFSGRTEFQHTVARPARRTVSFERRPSQR